MREVTAFLIAVAKVVLAVATLIAVVHGIV